MYNSPNGRGPAFPCERSEYMQNGMTLRDWFASIATENDIAYYQSFKPDGYISRACARYMYADDMIKERNKEYE